jgi:hypothetical protein
MSKGFSFCALLFVASCASHNGAAGGVERTTEVAMVSQCVTSETTVRDFYRAFAAKDLERIAEQSSFPFDLDGRDGCIESAQALKDAIAKDFKKPQLQITVGGIRPVTLETRDLPEPILDHLPRFLAADAKCRHPEGQAEPRDAQTTFSDFWVDFSVNGERVGGLTRVRCRNCVCRVAGIDN